MTPKMRVLCVLSSSNQMYSGIGRAVFELSRRLAERVEFTFAIDDLEPRNVGLVRSFAADLGWPVLVGRGRKHPETLDNGNDGLAHVIRSGRWDAIECVCWANAATNRVVMDHVGDAPLIYTPHDQPMWSVPMSGLQAEETARVHRSVVRRADLVLCDSPWERGEIRKHAPDRNNAAYVPLGCDFGQFRPGPADRARTLLFVGDLAEPRKRFDRVMEAMLRLRPSRPDLRLTVIGNRSRESADLIPETLRPACDLRGYVSEAELRAAYAGAAGLVLLSDFEAFGIPILEALACGTPVFLADLDPTRSLFDDFSGAHVCPGDDPDATARIIGSVLDRGASAVAECTADRPRLEARFSWDVLAIAKWKAMAAAWFRRNGWRLSA